MNKMMNCLMDHYMMMGEWINGEWVDWSSNECLSGWLDN